MSEPIPLCPQCQSAFAYSMDYLLVCPECGYEWQMEVAGEPPSQGLVVLDANGNALLDGDAVVVTKNLPVKGYPQPIKAGTRIKNIRLKDGDHNIDCKIDGFGAMALKSEFVKKG